MTTPSPRFHAMTNIKFPEPYLPFELERLIFELAVTQNGIKASTPLLLVAKRVCEWLRPLIFRVMYYTWRTVSLELPQSIAPFVQFLIIEGYYIDGSPIISSFPNITNLAIQGYYTSLSLQELSRLTRKLAVDSYYILPHDKSPIHPYSNLTHLSMHGSKANSSWEDWEFLAHLPNLTHINADEAIQIHIPKVLLLGAFLKLLVVEFFDYYKGLNYLDDRLVLMVGQNYTDRVLDWERGANRGVDLWIISERIVLARSRKYFAKSLPKLIPRNLEWEEYLNEDGKQWFHKL